jgi:prevent-host-death family protein
MCGVIKVVDSIRVPISRFKREFRKWMRRLQRNECIVIVTVNGVDDVVLLPPKEFEEMKEHICCTLAGSE